MLNILDQSEDSERPWEACKTWHRKVSNRNPTQGDRGELWGKLFQEVGALPVMKFIQIVLNFVARYHWCSWFFPWLQGHQESGAAILPLIYSELCEITDVVQESQIRWRDRVPHMNRVFDLSLGAFEALTLGNPKVCSTKRLGTTWAGSRRDIDPSLSKVCTIQKSWENIRCNMNIN